MMTAITELANPEEYLYLNGPMEILSCFASLDY